MGIKRNGHVGEKNLNDILYLTRKGCTFLPETLSDKKHQPSGVFYFVIYFNQSFSKISSQVNVKVMSSKETVEINHYWALEHIVQNNFNRFKGKLFNLIEATVLDTMQQDAIKGLIRGFANEEYRNCIENMRDVGRIAGYITIDEGVPITATPLETYPR